MVMDAQTRHALHLRLDELVGPESMAAVMTSIAGGAVALAQLFG